MVHSDKQKQQLSLAHVLQRAFFLSVQLLITLSTKNISFAAGVGKIGITTSLLWMAVQFIHKAFRVFCTKKKPAILAGSCRCLFRLCDNVRQKPAHILCDSHRILTQGDTRWHIINQPAADQRVVTIEHR